MSNITLQWENKLEILENTAESNWKLYVIWTLKYINFKQAILTSLYGLIGILLVYNLSSITESAVHPVEIWINTSLTSAFKEVQSTLQEGIDDIIGVAESEVMTILNKKIIPGLAQANGTLNEILSEKETLIRAYNSVISVIKGVDVIGPALVTSITCILPINILNVVDTAVDLMVGFLQEIMTSQLTFPRVTFPNMAGIATSATHIVVTRSMAEIQKQLTQYKVVFFILSIAFGILVLQALWFVGVRKVFRKIQEHRAQKREQMYA